MSTTDEAAAPDEIAALKRSCRILANITARNHQVMEAARIEMSQNGPHAAMQWILNNLPDVWDDDETAWDGKESAEAWFDRTEDFYRAQIAAAPPVEAGPAAGAPEALSSAPDRSREQPAASWRERAEAAEGKLAAIRKHCRAQAYGNTNMREVWVSTGNVLAIIGDEPEPRPTPAEVTRLDQMVTEHGNAVTAVREALEYAAERVRNREGTQLVVAATEALKVLSGEEGPGNG